MSKVKARIHVYPACPDCGQIMAYLNSQGLMANLGATHISCLNLKCVSTGDKYKIPEIELESIELESLDCQQPAAGVRASDADYEGQ